jgi:hypothetical protein
MLPERVPRSSEQTILPCHQPALHGLGADPMCTFHVFAALSVALLTSQPMIDAVENP